MKRTFATLVASFILAGIGGGCRGLEDSVVFRPTQAAQLGQAEPESIALPGDRGHRAYPFSLHCPDGTLVHAWWCPVAGSKEAILYCHGNAGDLTDRAAPVARVMEELGQSVLVFDYPGYGLSGGRPSEAGCYAAADAAYDWLLRQPGLTPEHVIICGISLGGGVAVDLASRHPVGALVLIKTFTSIPDVAEHILCGLPVGGLMTNRFDSRSKIGLCRQPLFVAVGEKDHLIPRAEGELLFAAAKQPKEFCLLRGSDHNDPLNDTFFEALRQFLATHGLCESSQLANR